jgi:hypothetical protein
MRYTSLAAASVGAMLLLAGSAAGRGAPVIPTQLQIGVPLAITSGPNEFVLSATGPLLSPRAKCQASRTVKLLFEKGGERTLVDVDTSSRSGQWGVSGRAGSQPDAFVLKVTRKRAKIRRQARICGADRVIRLLL